MDVMYITCGTARKPFSAKTMRNSQHKDTSTKVAYDRGMKTKTAVKIAGSAYKLAQMLGIRRQAVSKWGAEIPLLRQYQLFDKYPDLFRKEKKP